MNYNIFRKYQIVFLDHLAWFAADVEKLALVCFCFVYFLQNLRGWSNIFSDRSKLWLIQHWRTERTLLTWTIIKDNNCSFFSSLWMTLKTTRIWSFFDVWTFYFTPNCISLSNSRFILTFRYMTYQFKRNPNTIHVSKIICTSTTIFLKFYNKCVNKNEPGHHSSSC